LRCGSAAQETDIRGRIYWEHLGLIDREDYRRGWEKKLAWYRMHGVLPADEGSGPAGLLVTTSETSTIGFDSSTVDAMIRKYIVY
jgi:hypothetical protein